jgi:hypothetical protein
MPPSIPGRWRRADGVMEHAMDGVAVLVSGVTLFSGFGLGTVLMPAFALFFPVPVAIAATAIGPSRQQSFQARARGAQRGLAYCSKIQAPGRGRRHRGGEPFEWLCRSAGDRRL